jgi:transcriptional regulator with XRE-family HTH domain
MENVKEIIARNLTELRKSHKMTQSALAEKLNYSDKAISRWEHAETLPDIETLCRICEIYGVNFEYLLKKEPSEIDYSKPSKRNNARCIIICLIAICNVWLTATVLFTSIGTLTGAYIWQLFIWAIPASLTALSICNKIWWKSRICSAITASLTSWTMILSVYLQALQYNLWLLFVVGVPIQAIILLTVTMPQKKTR